MSSTKRVLGRGLADLIPVGGGAANALSESKEIGTNLGPGQEVSISQVHANPHQPRTRFDETALAELATSIQANGILQPILVRPRIAGGYEIVAGERRYRAALKAGLAKVPVIVRELSDEETLALALIENLLREDIGPLETARAFRRLMDDFGWTQEEMGQRVGKSRPSIANSLRLLELPEMMQQSLERGELTEGHARALLGDRRNRSQAAFQAHQLQIFQQITTKGLTVRDVERLMDTAPQAASAPAKKEASRVAPEEWKALEDQLRTALGTRVRLTGTPERGKIEIEFFSDEELDGLLTRLTKTPEQPESTDRSNSRIQGLLGSRRPL